MRHLELTSTFALCRAAGACPDGYKKFARRMGGVNKYGMNTPFRVVDVLDSNGQNDVIWVLFHAMPAEQRADATRLLHVFAADCAEHVLPIYEATCPDDRRPRQAIEAKRAWLRGEISVEELPAARDAALDAARAAATASARDAARAAALAASWYTATWASARAAAYAACLDAAWDTARAAAWAASRDSDWSPANDATRESDWQATRLRELLQGGSR